MLDDGLSRQGGNVRSTHEVVNDRSRVVVCPLHHPTAGSTIRDDAGVTFAERVIAPRYMLGRTANTSASEFYELSIPVIDRQPEQEFHSWGHHAFYFAITYDGVAC